jgi:hypothetical protein
MKKSLPAPTAKNINEAHQCARESADNAVEWAVKCGQLLAAKKEQLKHGEWESWVEKNCAFTPRSASAYMKVAAKQAQIGSALPISSIRQALEEDKPKPKPDTSARSVKGAVMNPPESAAQGSEAGNRETPVGVDAGRVRPPVPGPEEHSDEPERPDIDDEEEDAALARAEVRAREDRERRVDKILESDDQLAESLKQLTQQAALIGTLESTRDSYMRGKDAITKLLKAEQAKVARLEKKLKAAEEEIEKLRKRIAMTEAA